MFTMSHPFRLAPSGRVAVVEQGSPDHDVELVAALVSTRKGERELVPDFGVTDPTFGALERAEVTTGLKLFGPEVRVSISGPRPVSETQVAYDIDVDRG